MTDTTTDLMLPPVLALGFGGQLVASFLAAQRSTFLAAANLALAGYIFYLWWYLERTDARHHGA